MTCSVISMRDTWARWVVASKKAGKWPEREEAKVALQPPAWVRGAPCCEVGGESLIGIMGLPGHHTASGTCWNLLEWLTQGWQRIALVDQVQGWVRCQPQLSQLINARAWILQDSLWGLRAILNALAFISIFCRMTF